MILPLLDNTAPDLFAFPNIIVTPNKHRDNRYSQRRSTDSVEFAGVVVDGLPPLSVALTFGHQSHVLGLVVVVHEETKERQRDGRRNDAKDAIALTEARSFEEGRGHVTRDPSGDDVRRSSIGDH